MLFQWLNDSVTNGEVTFSFPLDYTTFLIAVQSSIRTSFNKYDFHLTQIAIEDNKKNFIITSLDIVDIDSLNSSYTWLKGQYYKSVYGGSYIIALMLP